MLEELGMETILGLAPSIGMPKHPASHASLSTSIFLTSFERLQDFITEYRTHKARIELNHMHEIANNAYLNYMKKQKEYADYCDSHQDLVLEAYKAKAENLENELQLAFNAFPSAFS